MAATHILMFPLPYQGPINAMLNLAQLLALSDLQITFLLTDHIHNRLNLQTRSSAFRIRTISDGLPEEHPRGDRFFEVFDSMLKYTKPLLKDMVKESNITCIIADGILGFTCDVANEIGIPLFYIRTISPACLWIFFCLPKLIQSRHLPFQGDDLDTMVKGVEGMEPYLRRRDLPNYCRSLDLNGPYIKIFSNEGPENSRSQGLILNTFEELDGPLLSQLRRVCPNIYTVGPLHALLNLKLAAKQTSPLAFSNSLWQEDQSCIAWLDAQAPKSVVYASFGSLVVMTYHQLMEFWHGLVNSGQRFLWVIRPDSMGVEFESQLPAELSRGTKERGYIVSWAPQQQVLGHPAVGGFMTHNGWNSTLESIYEGVPMIGWPRFVDQLVNSRLVEAVWKMGKDMKDSCDRIVIEKMVRDVMEVRKEEFVQAAQQMANAAKMCLREGGSSYVHFNRLLNDIKTAT